MGCMQSASGSGGGTADSDSSHSEVAAPAPKDNGMSLDDIMNMNKVEEDVGIPEGYPAEPSKPVFSDGDENEYKAYMRSKLKYESWENGLVLYKMRMKDGNTEAMEKIAARVEAELAEWFNKAKRQNKPTTQNTIKIPPQNEQNTTTQRLKQVRDILKDIERVVSTELRELETPGRVDSGMEFNSEKMRWEQKSGDNDDVFKDIPSLSPTKNTADEGHCFILSAVDKGRYERVATSHNEDVACWFPNDYTPNRSYLFDLKRFAIMKTTSMVIEFSKMKKIIEQQKELTKVVRKSSTTFTKAVKKSIMTEIKSTVSPLEADDMEEDWDDDFGDFEDDNLTNLTLPPNPEMEEPKKSVKELPSMDDGDDMDDWGDDFDDGDVSNNPFSTIVPTGDGESVGTISLKEREWLSRSSSLDGLDSLSSTSEVIENYDDDFEIEGDLKPQTLTENWLTSQS